MLSTIETPTEVATGLNERPVLVDDLIEEASQRFSEKDLAGARDALLRAVKQDGTQVELRLFLGNVLYHLHDPMGAQVQFERAIQLSPDSTVAYTSLAAVLMTLGRFSDSEKAIREVLKRSPEDLEALRFIGALALQTGKFSNGVTAYADLLKLKPDDIDALMSQGRCLYEVGDLASAGRNFAQVIALDPENRLAEENLSVVRSKAGLAADATPTEPEPDAETVIEERFEALGPWFGRFTIDGKTYGGDFSYANDPRLSDFLEWHRGETTRVMDLGAFEGAHSFALAGLPNVKEVLGVDVKAEVVARANLVKELIDADKVRFALCDVEGDDLEAFGRFDAVFCSGLLYHLAEPWKVIKKLSTMTDRLFLSTHYAETGAATQLHYQGVEYEAEYYPDLRGGVRELAFWPNHKSLVTMLTDHGFKISKIRDYPEWPDAPLVNLYCER